MSANTALDSKKGLKKTIGGRKRPPAPATEYWGLPEPAIESEAPQKGLKKTIGGRKQPPTSAVEYLDTSDTSDNSEPPMTGLKKTIDGRKPSPVPVVQSDSIKSLEPPKRGLKRTIGGAKAQVAAQPKSENKQETTEEPSSSTVPDRSKIASTGGNAIPTELNIDEEMAAAEARADEKRKALKKELEQNAKPKPKKRRF
jgi:hypothetical protein